MLGQWLTGRWICEAKSPKQQPMVILSILSHVEHSWPAPLSLSVPWGNSSFLLQAWLSLVLFFLSSFKTPCRDKIQIALLRFKQLYKWVKCIAFEASVCHVEMSGKMSLGISYLYLLQMWLNRKIKNLRQSERPHRKGGGKILQFRSSVAHFPDFWGCRLALCQQIL